MIRFEATLFLQVDCQWGWSIRLGKWTYKSNGRVTRLLVGYGKINVYIYKYQNVDCLVNVYATKRWRPGSYILIHTYLGPGFSMITHGTRERVWKCENQIFVIRYLQSIDDVDLPVCWIQNCQLTVCRSSNLVALTNAGWFNQSQPTGFFAQQQYAWKLRFYSQLAQNGFQACRNLSPLESLRLGIVSFMLVFRAEDVCWWLELETSAPSSPKHGQEQRVIAGFVKVFGALKSGFPSMKQTHHQFKASPRWIQNQCWPPRSTPHLNA